MILRLLAVLLLPLAAACDTVSYYSQAIGGHLEIVGAARPVADWLADPATSPELRSRLELARRIREFASRRLALPENRSYSSYAELGRPFVVWNVFAAPQFSVEPKKECFPFTGCVSYRGFYSEQDAHRHAARLKAEGYDVYVAGVPAYSTLGWFDDPLLSTFIRFPEAQLARIVFHELAHQVVYARDDTAFNESFAVAVEREGVRRWLEAEGHAEELRAFYGMQARRQQYADEVKATRARLAALYGEKDVSRERLLSVKREEFDKLRAKYPKAVPEEASNAFLVSIALYTELVPQFEQLLAESGSLQAFYDKVKALAKSGKRLKPPGPAAALP